MIARYLSILFAILLVACSNNENTNNNDVKASFVKVSNNQFQQYWYAGEAEISSYDLKQSRYGQVRDGDAVLVFVTEPFSKSKQVKLDYPSQAGKDNVSVLKLNAIRKFNTGIYDYSIMTSTFTPVDIAQYPHSLKSTTTLQEWCGHTFTQFNLSGNAYKVAGYSYFESEGDEKKTIDAAMLEDELWSRIRINPASIPTGELDLIPSTTFTRLKHTSFQPTKANISVQEQESTNVYKIAYLELDRTLIITTEKAFPHKILGWEEQSKNGGTTTAQLKETINSPYWSRNSNQYESMRADLGLPMSSSK